MVSRPPNPTRDSSDNQALDFLSARYSDKARRLAADIGITFDAAEFLSIFLAITDHVVGSRASSRDWTATLLRPVGALERWEIVSAAFGRFDVIYHPEKAMVVGVVQAERRA